MKTIVLYECDICGAIHPWDWNGDCRDDKNRHADEQGFRRMESVSSGDKVEVRSMCDRLAADVGACACPWHKEGSR